MMKRFILFILISLIVTSFSFAVTINEEGNLDVIWEFNPSEYYTYKFGFYNAVDGTARGGIGNSRISKNYFDYDNYKYNYEKTADTAEVQDLDNQNIYWNWTMYIGWEVYSPEARLVLKLSAAGGGVGVSELYGEAKVSETIPWEIKVTPISNYSYINSTPSEVTIGSTNSGGDYSEKEIVVLTPSASDEVDGTTYQNQAKGYATLYVKTGNAYGKAIQEYTGYLTLRLVVG